MKNRIEQVILENLIKDDDFVRKVIPFLKPEYFMAFEDNRVFKADGMTFLGKYNEDTSDITNESSDESEDDAFGSENDMIDGEVF